MDPWSNHKDVHGSMDIWIHGSMSPWIHGYPFVPIDGYMSTMGTHVPMYSHGYMYTMGTCTLWDTHIPMYTVTLWIHMGPHRWIHVFTWAYV